MIRLQADTKRLDDFHRAVSATLPQIQDQLLRPQLQAMMARIIATAPRDTRRYVRGWQMAANEAKLGPFEVSDIAPSTSPFVARIRAQFLEQAAYYEKRAREYEERAARAGLARSEASSGRSQRRLRRLVKGSAKLRQLADRAAFVARRAREEERKLTSTSILILGREGKQEFAVRRLITVRDEPKGGTGRKSVVGGVVVYTLRNLEPHAIIVEGKHGVVRRAQALGAGGTIRYLKAGMEQALRRIAAAGRAA